jgi:hypothetical protein
MNAQTYYEHLDWRLLQLSRNLPEGMSPAQILNIQTSIARLRAQVQLQLDALHAHQYE